MCVIVPKRVFIPVYKRGVRRFLRPDETFGLITIRRIANEARLTVEPSRPTGIRQMIKSKNRESHSRKNF